MLLLSESVRARTAGSARGGHRWLMMSLPLKRAKTRRGGRIRVEGTSYEAPDIGDYTVPSLSWVVAMAHRDYIVHRGIYSRCRRRFLPTRRFLIAGLAGMTCLALGSSSLPASFFEKSPTYERCFRGAALQRPAVNPRERLKKKNPT